MTFSLEVTQLAPSIDQTRLRMQINLSNMRWF